jgi:adenylate cyclase
MPIHSALRVLRLVSGLILMVFVVSHLANLSLGLQSLATMEDWLPTLMGPWQTPIGSVLLAGSAILHVLLGLYAIAARHTLAMNRTDVAQLILGIFTPPLLLNHVIVMGMTGKLVHEFEPSYGQILAVYWSIAPALAFQQLFAVIFVWVHAAIGLYSWLVLKPVWRRIGGVVLPVLFAVPILGLLGFAEAGKEVLDKLASDADWRGKIVATIDLIKPVRVQLDAAQAQILSVYGVLLLLALAVYAARHLRNRLLPVRVAYDDGLSAAGRRGLSILELSRLNGIPHADVCSGRGRCGTCRVHVNGGAEHLSPLNDIERTTLKRVGAAAGDRLACQARVLRSGVAVTRLLPPYADASAARQPGDWAAEHAVPMEIAGAGAVGGAAP